MSESGGLDFQYKPNIYGLRRRKLIIIRVALLKIHTNVGDLKRVQQTLILENLNTQKTDK